MVASSWHPVSLPTGYFIGWYDVVEFRILTASLCTRSLPAVCGGDVRTVDTGVKCGGCLRSPPARGGVSGLPAVPHLWSVLHVCPHWDLLLSPGRTSFPPDWPSHPDTQSLTSVSGSLEEGDQDFWNTSLWYIHTLPRVWQLCGVNYLSGLNTCNHCQTWKWRHNGSKLSCFQLSCLTISCVLF